MPARNSTICFKLFTIEPNGTLGSLVVSQDSLLYCHYPVDTLLTAPVGGFLAFDSPDAAKRFAEREVRRTSSTLHCAPVALYQVQCQRRIILPSHRLRCTDQDRSSEYMRDVATLWRTKKPVRDLCIMGWPPGTVAFKHMRVPGHPTVVFRDRW